MRLTKTEYNGGLYVAGMQEGPAAGSTLRRAMNIAPIKVQGVRSRLGSRRVAPLVPSGPVHSVYRYNGKRFVGAGSVLYDENAAVVHAFLTGDHWSFSRMPPQEGQNDWLFVAGAGTPFKVSPTGTVEQWGILPPLTNALTAVGVQQNKQINPWSAASVLTPAGPDSGSVTGGIDAVSFQTPPSSITITLPADKLGGFVTTNPVGSLVLYPSGAVSGNEDFIELWVQADKPTNIEYLQIAIDVGDATFNHDYFVKNVFIHPEPALGSNVLRSQTFGLSDSIQLDQQTDKKNISVSATANILEGLGNASIDLTPLTWTKLRIPKSSFARVGGSGTSWEAATVVRVLVKTAARGPAEVWLNDMRLVGNVGMLGDYQYLCTFLNNNTGNRSNANTTPTIITGIERHAVSLTNIPVSADPQVTHVEIWRTIGNGGLFFFAFRVPNGTTSHTDTTADYYGLDTKPGATVLGDEELPTFNANPHSAVGDVLDAAGPWQERMWFLSSTPGNRGRVYYSPAGLPESVEGFITPSNDDDPMSKLVIWNNALFAFATHNVFQVDGTTVPFTYHEVYGAPGSSLIHAIVGTPYGIAYFVPEDGLRLLDGIFSRLIGYDAVGVLFRGEGSVDLPSGFFPTVLDYARNELYLIDASGNTLIYDFGDGHAQRPAAWRETDVLFSSVYYEPDTKEILAGLQTKAVLWETLGQQTDDGVPVAFAIRTPNFFIDVVDRSVLQYVFFDGVLNGQVLTPTVFFEDGTSQTLPTITGTTRRAFEFPIDRDVRAASIQLVGAVSQEVQIYRLEADFYVPEEVQQELRA